MNAYVKHEKRAPVGAFANAAYFAAGLGFLLLSKVNHSMRGYTSARGFPISQTKRAIEYDFMVVNRWLEFLREYAPGFEFGSKTVLELGPGSDLGIGLVILANGAKKYNALDVNNLVANVPATFYEELFAEMKGRNPDKTSTVDCLKVELSKTVSGRPDKLNYVCRKDFDVRVFKDEGIDMVVSNAAFEHFDDIARTISQVSSIVKKGSLLAIELDLQTHSRWIRYKDPLNIYRYPDALYNLFKFPGSPNRKRPLEYARCLEQNGWEDVRVMPVQSVGRDYLKSINNGLAKRFRDGQNQMELLSVMVCARKGR